ncbi:two-component system NarL family sensor kinase [Pedobacter africanus]|uniref:Signal transduction histidine kinase n=1 Tax=Pedobacter africanus TaxID=151894 RepID=A0ACC6KR48_9SPHI|nr:ATP-binding protein [Pedobacter africanus]MDR6781828.1 signal transduction histidine kinase [Pedobacter africanus]
MSAFLRDMIRAPFLSFFLVVLAFSSSGQDWKARRNKIEMDSLKRVVNSDRPDSIRARASYLLSSRLAGTDKVKSRYYLEKGRILSGKSVFMQTLYLYYQAQSYMIADDKRASHAYEKARIALLPFKTREAYLFQAGALSGSMLTSENLDNRAYVELLIHKVLPLAEKSDDSTMIAQYNYRIATYFMFEKQHRTGAAYFKRAAKLLRGNPANFRVFLMAYLWAVSNHIAVDEFEQAKEMLDELELILWPYPSWSGGRHYYYNESLYSDNDHSGKKLDSLLRKWEASGHTKGNAVKRMLLSRKYDMLIEARYYELAKFFLEDMLQSKLFYADAESRKIIYDQLVKANSGIGMMDEAYHWSKAYSKLNDSIHASRLEERLSEMEIKYRNAENQQKIVQLEAENERAVLYSKNTRLVILSLVIAITLLLVLAAFGFYYYRNRSRLMTTNAMLEGEERERERVARELHDGLGGMLAGVKIKLSAWGASQVDKGGNFEFNRIVSELDNSVKELRHISRNLMPESLLRFGLETALKDLCESVMTEPKYIDFQSFQIQSSLPLKTQLNVYRIVQELLNNAIRHSGASHIIIQCSQNQETFFITVEDNGKGFEVDLNVRADVKGLGLANVKKRVDFMKGRLQVESVIGSGTTIHIELNVAA